jgi:alpha-mannosidase
MAKLLKTQAKMTRRSSTHAFLRILFGIFATAAGLLPQALGQQGQVLFTMGQFDGSSQEFSAGLPTNPVRVHSEDITDTHLWYAFQPVATASGKGLADAASAPRTILFTVAGKPVSAYTIHVSLLIEHASVPGLHVEIDGHHGTFYLQPKLDNRIGDGGAVSFPSFSQATVSFEVPGAFLHTGENEIAFSAVSTPPGNEVPDAGFNYDAIAMFEGGSADTKEFNPRIEPTVFYKLEHGHLEEGLDVTLRLSQAPVQSALLTVNGARVTLSLNGTIQWGEQRRRIYVPAFGPHTQARIEVTEGGRTEISQRYLDPAKRWTVYVVPHVHLDLGYTDYQAKVESVQSRIIDEAIDLFALHPRFRFSVDGMWSFEQFLNTRTANDRTRALTAMKAGQFFVPAQYSNELTGFASAETLLRSLYPSAQFSREHGTPLNYANITDVPSYSWSYASILASAGIHDLLAGSNNGRAPVLLRGHLDEMSPFYWQGPDGQRVLFWYARHYHQMWTIFGLPPLLNAGEETLPLFLEMYGRPTYKASSTIIYGSQVENTDLYPGQAELVDRWNKQYAFPHLTYSGFYEALTSVAAEFKGNIPMVRGDGGPYWEDGIASDAYYAAMERETEARAPSAEKLATISSLGNPRIAVDHDSFNALWKNMVLMDEHTWGSSESFSDSQGEEATVQLAFKDAHAMHAHELSDTLLRRSMADIADTIDTPVNSLVVFNTLNWQRSGMVSLDLPKGIELIDRTTGQVVPVEAVAAGETTNRVSFWAQDLSSTGYKTYLLRQQQTAAGLVASAPRVMENQFYRVELDPSTGAVRSIFDKQLGRELVDESSPYKLGEYLYVTTDDGEHDDSRFMVHGAAGGKLVSMEQTPQGITARLESTDVNTPRITAAITLSSHKKQILFTEDVDKVATKDDEAVYFAFPFAMDHPEFEYEIQNGVVNPARDMYPGAGLDWFSVQHWAAVQQDGVSAAVMPLDASLMTFGDISRLRFPQSFGARKGWLFSYAMNNYWHVNYRAEQGGHFQFRYVVTSAAKTDEVGLSHYGWEEITPLEVTEVTPSDKAVETKRPLRAPSGSFLSMIDPALVLDTWKPAEDGRGTILRFIELGGAARTVRMGLPRITIQRAWLTDALERDRSELKLINPHTVVFPVKAHEIVTVRVLNRVTEPPACGRFCNLSSTQTGGAALSH